MEDESKIEEEIYRLLNNLRKDPDSFVDHVRDRKDCFDNEYYTESTGQKFKSESGVAHYEKCIVYLDAHEGSRELILSKELSNCAREHCEYLCKSGKFDHESSGKKNLDQRIKQYGNWRGCAGECVCLESSSALDVVLGLLIDDGVRNTENRNHLMNDEYHIVGIAFRTNHKVHQACAVLIFASVFQPLDRYSPDMVSPDNYFPHMPEELKKMGDNVKQMKIELETLISSNSMKNTYKVTHEFEDGSTKTFEKSYE